MLIGKYMYSSSYGRIPSICIDPALDRSIGITFILRLENSATEVFVLLNIFFLYQPEARLTNIEAVLIYALVKIHVLLFPY